MLARVLLIELDAQDKRVEAKEYYEGTGQALNDHPTLHAEDLGLDGARVERETVEHHQRHSHLKLLHTDLCF